MYTSALQSSREWEKKYYDQFEANVKLTNENTRQEAVINKKNQRIKYVPQT